MSAKQKEIKLSNSSGPVASLKREQSPPPYGAQHRQDALWEGGNEALPPMWTEFKVGRIDKPTYQDDALFMLSLNRPLPGVRLEYPGQLIPGCEWHISPLGRSYFVNHNTRTTSWKKPTPERLAGSLMPECTIKCGSSWYRYELACLGTSGNIMSISNGSIRQWTKVGRPVGKPFGSDVGGGFIIAVSPDGLMVVGKCGGGTVRLWNIKEGSLVGHPWEGNNDEVLRCFHWSPNGAEVAGGFKDGTIRRWNPATGRQIAPPTKRNDKTVWTIKYSPQGDKLASGGNDDMIGVWSKDGKLLIEITGHDYWVMSLCWSKDGAYIFSASHDTTIRKWQSIDGEELVVFRGHTQTVTSLCLSPDGSHLLSASLDHSVRIWDLETNQQVGDPLWHDDQVWSVVMSSDGQYFASAITGLDAKIYVWSLEAALKRARGIGGDAESNAKPKGCAPRYKDISFVPRQQNNNLNRGLARYGNDFWGEGSNRTSHHSVDIPSPPRLRDFFGFLRSSTRPADAPPSIQLQPRRLNFSSFPLRISRRPVDVPPCREEDRYGITPESDAEAAAAMQRTNSNNVDSSTQQVQAVAGTQGSQGHSAQGQGSDFEAGEPTYLMGCCGFYLVRRRPVSN